MTTHEPTVYDDGPTTTPRYRTDWHGTTPQPTDLILMSVELFERCIHILNATPPTTGETPGAIAYRAWWEELNRYHHTEIFHDDWAEITDGARSGWEASAQTIIRKYGATNQCNG